MKKAIKRSNQVNPEGGGEAGAAPPPTFVAESPGSGSGPGAPRLPPIATPDGALSTLNQATITNATFKLNASGGGVATFEFRSLQPLPPKPTPPARLASPEKQAARSLSGGDVKKKAESWHKWLKGVMKGLFTTFYTLGTIVVVTIVGNLAFSHLEVDAENSERADYTAAMIELRAKYNMTDEDFGWCAHHSTCCPSARSSSSCSCSGPWGI